MTFVQVTRKVGISVSHVSRIFDRFAGVAPISMPKCPCIDEIYAVKYKQMLYVCVLEDKQTRQVYDLLSSRRKINLSGFLKDKLGRA